MGADAEVRESNPTQNRGDSTEIASRVRNDFIAGAPNAGGDRNSAIYTMFDLSGTAAPADIASAFGLTYRNNNLADNRIQDTITPNPAIRTGMVIYGLDPTLTWSEDTITYLTAPGLTLDGDGDGDAAPDGAGVGTDTASVRAERDRSGNGRVYTIGYSAADANGGQCSGVATVQAGLSQGANSAAVGDGPLYDSTVS
jgi:hypothetical protein